MEKVTGGGSTIIVQGQEMGEAEFDEFFQVIREVMGFDVAVEMLQAMTGYYCDEMHPGSSLHGSDRDRMDVILHRLWSNYNGSQY